MGPEHSKMGKRLGLAGEVQFIGHGLGQTQGGFWPMFTAWNQ
jgi:hypothetical protein